MDRKPYLKKINRVVIKVGSGVLTRKNGLNLNLIDDITTEICWLRKKGIEVILVSSGAIAAGLKKAGLSKRPGSVSQMQALAAMGQSSLIMAYEEAFARHGKRCAQILLTRDDLTHRRRYLNARNTLITLLAWGVIPIINENDTVGVDEIKFGDNDNLAALITNLTESQFLVNLTNIEGLYDRDPRVHKDAELVSFVEKLNNKLSKAAGSIPGFLGTGGMASKLTAAKKVALGGVPSVIASGFLPNVLKDVFSGKPIGTFFKPMTVHLNSKKQWIAFTKSPSGEITIDEGAQKAILKNGKSLLPSGIIDVQGRFSTGSAAVLKDAKGKDLAVGLVNYSSDDLRKIKGAKTSAIEARLGYKHDDEVIHRDNLVSSDLLDDK